MIRIGRPPVGPRRPRPPWIIDQIATAVLIPILALIIAAYGGRL